MSETRFRVPSEFSGNRRLVAAPVSNGRFVIRDYDTNAPVCKHENTKDALEHFYDDKYTSRGVACPRCAEKRGKMTTLKCGHAVEHGLACAYDNNGACVVCDMHNDHSPEERTRFVAAAANLAIGGFWDDLKRMFKRRRPASTPAPAPAPAPAQQPRPASLAKEEFTAVVPWELMGPDVVLAILIQMNNPDLITAFLRRNEITNEFFQGRRATLVAAYFLAHVKYTFPMYDDDYRKKYFPAITHRRLASSEALKRYWRLYYTDEYKDYVNHNESILNAIFNIRDPAPLLMFMGTLQKVKHSVVKLFGAEYPLWVQAAGIFITVSDMYSFDFGVLFVSLGSPDLMISQLEAQAKNGWPTTLKMNGLDLKDYERNYKFVPRDIKRKPNLPIPPSGGVRMFNKSDYDPQFERQISILDVYDAAIYSGSVRILNDQRANVRGSMFGKSLETTRALEKYMNSSNLKDAISMASAVEKYIRPYYTATDYYGLLEKKYNMDISPDLKEQLRRLMGKAEEKITHKIIEQ